MKAAIAFLLTIFLTYLAFAFAQWSFDPAIWSFDARVFCVTCMACMALSGFAMAAGFAE